MGVFFMDWPIYKKEFLILGNPEANLAVISCWTNRSEVEVLLGSMDEVLAIGNLYSPNRGLDFLIANTLAHPNLAYLVIWGADRLKSGDALVNLRQHGFERGRDSLDRECWLVKNFPAGRISMDFSADDLELFRQVEIYDLRGCDKEVFRVRIRDLKNLSSYTQVREPCEIKLTEVRASKSFPTMSAAHRVVGRTVAEVWLKALDHILKFGVVSNTQYQSLQQECLDLTSVITEEDPSHPFVPTWFPFDESYLKTYIPTVVEKIPTPDGISYYYGQRMRIEWGDQLEGVIQKLKASRDTRQAVISFWDAKNDLKIKDSPCLNHIWFRVQDGRLYLIATIRSNDMVRGFPANALALRHLQAMVRNNVDPEIPLGHLVIHSQSSHIYDETWEIARTVVKKHWKEVVEDDRNVVDPGGIFLVSVADEKVSVQHLTPNGEFLQEFSGRTAMSIYLKLVSFVTITEHALYLGTELQKAEFALNLGVSYVQDKSLTIPGA